jgi:hypothetical protein
MTETKKEERCPVNFDKATYQAKKFIAKGQGKSIAESERKLTDMLMQLVAVFDKNPFVITYEFQLFPEKQLIIKAEGQSSLVIGQVDEKELEAERKAHFQEVALSIAEINNKEVK